MKVKAKGSKGRKQQKKHKQFSPPDLTPRLLRSVSPVRLAGPPELILLKGILQKILLLKYHILDCIAVW